jgi:beta-galactosidase
MRSSGTRQLDDAPFVYITSRRFNPRTTATATVKVYSNMDSVSLQVNGTAIAASTGAERIFTWTNVALAPAPNTDRRDRHHRRR